MLAPNDLKHMRQLVDDHGDVQHKRALARIVLTLIGQPTDPPPTKINPDDETIDDVYNRIIQTPPLAS